MLWREAAREGLALLVSSNCLCFNKLLQVHAKIVSLGQHQNVFLASLLITKYCSFGRIQAARLVLHSVEYKPGPLLWNSMMRGCLKNRQFGWALDVYHEMVSFKSRADEQTFHLVIKACTELAELDFAVGVHESMKMGGVELGALVGTELINIYCKFGRVDVGRQVFDEMLDKDSVAWNAMIAGYARSGLLYDAMKLFCCMRCSGNVVRPTEATFISLISACGNSRWLIVGEVVCADVMKLGFENFVSLCNSIIEMYNKCKCVAVASKLFDGMLGKDVVSWNSMIAGYAQNGCEKEALLLFHRMLRHAAVVPTRATLLNVLRACADLRLWQEGERLVKYCRDKAGLEMDVSLGTALISMYTKCRKMNAALKLFSRMPDRDVITWNTMVKAYVDLEQYNELSNFLLNMQCHGILPDEVTMLIILPMLASTASLRKGNEAHTCVIRRGLNRDRAVANALIDMYAKCGKISYSRAVFERILDKDVVSWTAIISGYAIHGDCNEALSLFALMQQSDATPNDYTFTAVLTACNHAGLVEMGREIFRSMSEVYGIKPSVRHCACMADLFCRIGLLAEAYQMAQAMPTDSAKVWGSILSACRIYCNPGLAEKVATHLFKLEPRNAANYVLLASIYVSAGRRKDANRILRLLKENDLPKDSGASWIV
ncbi:pentatricopeptide repeat-containing protein DOT4, chloroplastic-like [Nymphaea colorata]|nr:pentatricopeptide repeat-containing protein DOT4, chloroplastic-like [Nymphaea colorata]